MPLSNSGTIATLTGTETLSNLASNANVTVSGTGFQVYTLASNQRLRLTGTLTIDPRKEMLVVPWGGSNNDPGVEIRSGGHLIIGQGITSPTSGRATAATSYGFGLGLIISADGPQCCDDGSLDVLSGGHLEINGATVWTRGVHRWLSGCQVTVRDGWIMNVDPSGASATNNTRIRIEEGGGINIDGLVTSNLQLDYRSTEAFGKFEGLQPRDIAIGVENGTGGSTRGRVKTWRAVPDPRDTARAFASNWDCADDVRIVNSEAGSATLIVPDRTTSLPSASRSSSTTFVRYIDNARTIIAINDVTGFATGQWIQIGVGATAHRRVIQGLNGFDLTLNEALPAGITSGTAVTNIRAHGGRIYHEVKFKMVDAAGDGIDGAKVHCVDTDHGERRVTDTAGTIDETADNTYTETANADGETGTMSVLTAMWYRMNSVPDLAAPDGNEVVDIRGKEDTLGDDRFDFGIWAYGFLGQRVQNVVLNGTEEKTVEVALLRDPAITETDRTVVEAYTELSSAERVYDFVAAQIYNNHAGEAGMPFTRNGSRLTWTGSTNIQLRASGNFVYRVLGNGTVEIVVGSTFAGDIVTGGTVTVGTGVTVEGAIIDTTGVLVAIEGLPANASATVIAWPASQGDDDRENEISASIPSSDTTSTSVNLRLAANTRYKLTADAISYKRSAVIDLDTTTQATQTVSLEEITDAQGNALVVNTLSGLTQAEQTQVGYVDWTVADILVNSTGPISFRAAAYAVEHGQSSATAQVSLHHPARIENGRILFPSSTSQKWRRNSAASGVPDIEAFQIGKDGSSDAADYINFAGGAIKYKSEPPITAPVNVLVAPVQASQADFTTLMGGVSQAVKDTYKGTGGGGGTALTQTNFDSLMSNVPDGIKATYKGAGGDVHSIYERVVTPQSAEVTSTIDAVNGIYATANNAIFDGTISVDGGSAVSIALTPISNEIRAVDIVSSINALAQGMTASFDTATQRITLVRDDAGHGEYFELGGSTLWNLIGFAPDVIHRGTDGLPFLRDIEGIQVTPAQIVQAIQAADFDEGDGTETLAQVLGNIRTDARNTVTNLADVSRHDTSDIVHALRRGSTARAVAPTQVTRQHDDPNDDYYEITQDTSGTITVNGGTPIAVTIQTGFLLNEIRANSIATDITTALAGSGATARYDAQLHTLIIETDEQGSNQSLQLRGDLFEDIFGFDDETVYRGTDSIFPTTQQITNNIDAVTPIGRSLYGFFFKGVWVSGGTYAISDIVYHNGYFYRANNARNALTTLPPQDSQWQLLAFRDELLPAIDAPRPARTRIPIQLTGLTPGDTYTIRVGGYGDTNFGGQDREFTPVDYTFTVSVSGGILGSTGPSGSSPFVRVRTDGVTSIIFETRNAGINTRLDISGTLLPLLGIEPYSVYGSNDSFLTADEVLTAIKTADFDPGAGDMTLGGVLDTIRTGVTNLTTRVADVSTHDTEEIANRLRRGARAIAASPAQPPTFHDDFNDDFYNFGENDRTGTIAVNGTDYTLTITAPPLLNNYRANYIAEEINTALANSGASCHYDGELREIVILSDNIGADQTLQFSGTIFTEVLGFDPDTIYTGLDAIVPQVSAIVRGVTAALPAAPTTDQIAARLVQRLPAIAVSPTSASGGEYTVVNGETI